MHYWWTGDYHFGHANIIRFCKRPWLKKGDLNREGHWKSKDIAELRCKEMDEDLITRWNRRVKLGDIVYHNGDLCFRNSKGGKPGEGTQNKASYYLDQLNGDKILIKGNHDKNNGVKTLIEKMIIKYGHHYICLVHDPADYDPNFKINFVGHIHERWKFKRKYDPMIGTYTDLINIGIDQWDYQPVTFEEIYKEYKRWLKKVGKDWKGEYTDKC